MAFHIARNDTAPPIEATLTDADGVPVNLTSATVRFHMRDSSQTVKVNALATIVTPSAGLVRYNWAAVDTNQSGRFEAQWQVTFADTTIRTFPSPGRTVVIVTGDIA